MRRVFSGYVFSAALAALCTCAQAFPVPGALQKIIASSGFAEGEIGLYVADAGSGRVIAEHNASKPMKPASSVKTVVTLAALETLGPTYTWKSVVSASGFPDSKGRVSNLVITGGGDPHLVSERLWLLAHRLSSVGVRSISGDIAVDRSFFADDGYRQGSFDGAGDRSYNVAQDAFLVNYKTASVTFVPKPGTGTAAVSVLPELYGVSFPKTVPVKPGKCGDWKKALRADLSKKDAVRFAGHLPAGCGQVAWHMSIWEADDFVQKALKGVFSQVGIVWKGRVKPGKAARNSVRLVEFESESLAAMVGYTNKYSNNPMARTIFLTLGKREGVPANAQDARKALGRWLEKRSVPAGGIFVDNGSGLSRETRISARTLGTALTRGYSGPYAAEFISSLPIAGTDGTMKRRPIAAGSAHVKTGYLKDARSVAGYVTATDGRRYAVCAMVNADKVDRAKDFLDRVLAWVGKGCQER